MYPITPNDPSVSRRTYDLRYVRTYVFHCYSVPAPSRPITKFSAHPDLKKLIRFADIVFRCSIICFNKRWRYRHSNVHTTLKIQIKMYRPFSERCTFRSTKESVTGNDTCSFTKIRYGVHTMKPAVTYNFGSLKQYSGCKRSNKQR